jgi:hypothetical protein
MTPRTDWQETVAPGEAEQFERYAEALRDLATPRGQAKKVDRALHAKANLGVLAELTVLPDLPEHARAGIFAAPATYKAFVRFSNGSGKRDADSKPNVRGVAIKVVGAPGKKIIPGLEDAKTQDFLLIRSPATPFRDAHEFVSVVLGVAQPWRLPAVAWRFGAGRLFRLLKQLGASLAAPMTSLATTRYWSAVPVKLGAYAIHYALFPDRQPQPAVALSGSFDALGEELASTLRDGPVSYDLRVQFYVDPTRTPIEDASVEWKEEDAPFLTVARLVLPKQDPSRARGRAIAAAIEGFAFDPWHATEDHRPLGNMMRARNPAYRLSTQARGAPAEPDGTESYGG